MNLYPVKKNCTICILLIFFVFFNKTYHAISQNYKKIDSLYQLIYNTKEDSIKIRLKLEIYDYYKLYDTARANQFLTGIVRQIENGEIRVAHNVFFKIGRIIENDRNDHSQALKYYEKASEEARKTNDFSYITYEAWIGYVLSKTGDNKEEAVKKLFHALEIAENNNVYDKLPRTYLLLAFVYRNNENYDKAEWYFKKSIESSQKIGDSTDIHYALNELGNIYLLKKNFKLALTYLFESLKIRERLNQPDVLAYSYHDIARGFFLMDSTQLALDYFFKVEEIAKNTNNIWLLFYNYMDINSIYIKLRQFQKANNNFAEMQMIADRLKMKTIYNQLFHGYYEYYKASGNYEYALKYYELEIKYQDSLTNENIQKNISELDKKYETVKKDKEIIRNQEHIKRQQLILYTVIIGLIILFFLMIIILWQYRQKKQANKILAEQKEEITAQRDEIEKNSIILRQAFSIIEQKNLNITSSIKYAQRIQQAILPSAELIAKLIPESFIIFKPKDIVSGDFYWLDHKEENIICFAAVDCTGHGVPGAFMSIHAFNLLDKAFNGHNLSTPSRILDFLSENIHKTLQQKDNDNSVKDSMDISLCSYNGQNGMLQYAGANQSLIICRKEKLMEIKPDKHPVGFSYHNEKFLYRNHEIQTEKEDIIYIFTDGFADQFGGAHNKKFLIKNLKEMLTEIAVLPLHAQKIHLEDAFIQWKGDNEQVDDVLVIGIKI